jgi:xanthine dehydrogenase accessory factor
MKCGGEVSVFIDVLRPAARVVLYGAGHVGERVANLAAEAGLSAVVVDDRPEFAQRERFPRAALVRCVDLEKEPLGGVSPGPEDFVVVLTRCHALDEAVLEAALRSPARYVGLIGSRRKVALILRSIARRLGRDPRADVRLHAPVGLKLGDKSPGEIAISILAEVLLVKSSGELAHNRLGPRASAETAVGRFADAVEEDTATDT